jgi:DNA replication protein DnaC
MTLKRVLCPQRIRQIPPQFSWVDHRLVRERYIERCDHPAAALYLFLVTVNRPQIQNLFHLRFIEDRANVIFISNVGLGKSHFSIALGHTACLRGYSVLFTTAVDIINSLSAAQAHGNLKRELHKYLQPRLLIVDEIGYLPIDKHGADLLFQVISGRYERGATILTSNRAYKHWPEIFNNDSTLTSALLDRLLHHAETVLIEGKSYRMKDQIEA